MDLHYIPFYLHNNYSLWFKFSILSKDCNERVQKYLKTLSSYDVINITSYLIDTRRPDNLKRFLFNGVLTHHLIVNDDPSVIITLLRWTMKNDCYLDKIDNEDSNVGYCSGVLMKFLRTHPEMVSKLSSVQKKELQEYIEGHVKDYKLNYLAQAPLTSFWLTHDIKSYSLWDMVFILERIDDNYEIMCEGFIRGFLFKWKRTKSYPDFIDRYGLKITFPLEDRIVTLGEYYHSIWDGFDCRILFGTKTYKSRLLTNRKYHYVDGSAVFDDT